MAASKEKLAPKKTAEVEKKAIAPKSPAKSVTVKTSTTKAAAKPKVASAAKPKTSTKKTTKISAEQHYKMVEVAAYYIAEKNDFKGSPSDYWIAAEAQIKALLEK